VLPSQSDPIAARAPPSGDQLWALGGNTVSFNDDANVRGHLGLRVGASYQVWTGTTMEPFVIGSVWGNLSGDNKAHLTSFGTSFAFTDDLTDAWGVVSTGVNFFAPGEVGPFSGTEWRLG
jgi:outer membrane autotransporter protein